MSSLARKMEVSTKGITIDEIKMVMQEELKTLYGHINKLTMVMSTIDNRLAGIEKRLESNKPVSTPAKAISSKFNLPSGASRLLSNEVEFLAIADMIFHSSISFSTFKVSFIEKAKELGKDIRKIIPSLKSVEFWALLEKNWTTTPATKVIDKTVAITLKETIEEAGINVKALNTGLEKFYEYIDSGMFGENKLLTLDNYRHILKELKISLENRAANLDSKLRLYISEILYNVMTTNN